MQNIEKIYEQHFKTVYKYLFCLTHNGDLAEELTQETFYKAVKNISTFKNECKMSVWLCQIAKNTWYDELRKTKRNETLDEENLMLSQEQKEIEKIIDENESETEFYKRIKILNEQARKVIYLRIVENMSFKEIADILGKTENWACVTFYRAKKKLKEVDENEREKGM